MTREKFSNWIWSGFFTVKKLSFWLQTSLSEPNFWLAPLWGQLGMAYPLRLTGVKSADFYPPNSRFWYFFGFFWLGCLEILVCTSNAWKPGSHVSPKKSKNATLKCFDFFDFFFLFSKMAVDRIRMIFQTPNKGSTCFKHHKFLNFDEKKYPQNFYTTDFKISLVPCS